MSDSLHNPNYPDCPLWMRISDMPRKVNTNTISTAAGKKPSNMKIPWNEYESQIVELLDDGADNREIANYFGLPLDVMTQKIGRMVRAGEYVPKARE